MLTIILANAVVIGLETYPEVMQQWGDILHRLDHIMLWIFVVELFLRAWAAPSRADHFRSGWTWFDIVVVAIAFAPSIFPQASVARVLRVFRVLRTVSMFPQLRLLVTTLLRSLPSLINIMLLLSILFYLYGVIGTMMFGATSPDHFGRIDRTLLTLFGIVTLEGWVEVMNSVRGDHPWAWIYFLSFILFGTFVVVNLFVAVVVNNLQESHNELLREALRATTKGSIEEIIVKLKDNLEEQDKLQQEAADLLKMLRDSKPN